ncbi:MAG: hypothetical protein HY942_06555 [Gammaproteobacteria bacterium]|nr:hypothetical protein [Gammaproteobacteria bacterium]
MHPKFKKTLKRSAMVVGSVVIGVPLLLMAINAVDQDLKPEVIAFADLSNDEVPEKDNGYFAWVGLAAPIGENPHALGVKIIAQVNEQLDSIPMEMIEMDTLFGSQQLKFRGNMSGLCGRDSAGCLDRYRSKIGDIRSALHDNQILLKRYRALYTYPHFRETVLPRIHAPIFFEPVILANLFRAQQALVALKGNPRTALRNLREDSVYWRRILEQSRSLINRMIAVASIHGNAQLVSEIVATVPLDGQTLAIAADAVRPLVASGYNLSKVFRYEFAHGMHVFAHASIYSNQPCPSDLPWSYCLLQKLADSMFLKPNATINLHYETYRDATALNRLPLPDFIKTIRARRADEQSQSDWPWSWHFAYNPAGKIYSSMSSSIYDSYTGRIHNLDGFLRLVSLQIAIKQAAIRNPDIPEFLGRALPELRNPYTGEPMQWDSQNRTLYFNGMSEGMGENGTNEKSDDELLGKRIELRL